MVAMTPAETTVLKTITPLFDQTRRGLAPILAEHPGYDPLDEVMELRHLIMAACKAPNYDLTQYRLCLPVNSAGEASGLAAYVDPAPVLPILAQPFVKAFLDSLVVTCPIKGATTKSVKRTRVEFQGKHEAEFTTAEPKRHEVAFIFRKPADVPGMKAGDEIVIAQFHCGEFPMCKIKARLDTTGFTIRAFVKHEAKEGAPDTAYTLAQAVPFDMPQTLVMEWFPGGDPVPQHLLFSINGLPVPPKAVPMDYPALAGIAPVFGVYWQKEYVSGEPVRYACVEFMR